MGDDMKELCKDLKRRYQNLKSERSVAEQSWEEIEELVMPYRGRFFKDQKHEGSMDWNREDTYDSTAVMAHQNLAAAIHGSLSSPALQWFEMRFRDKKLNANKAAATWLSSASDTTYYALQDSNFNLEINETYQDVSGFGSSALGLEGSQSDDLKFSSVPLKEFCFETTWDGKVARFYRHLEWEPAKILSRFGTQVPERILELDKKGSQEKLDVLFCVYPTGNRMAALAEKQKPSRRAFAYCYFLMSDCEMLGKPGGYYEMPMFVPRWRVTSGSMWGNSPAHFALADVKSLNRARKIQLVGSEKAIDPPIFAEERSIIADLDLSAASLNVVRNIAGIKPYDSKFNVFVSDHMVTQLQEGIRNYFFWDQLNMPAAQAQPMTATEAQIRYELMQKLLGPTMGRLQNDLLTPIVSRAFRMLLREGVIPPPPEEVVAQEAQFDIEYLGSLSRAQKSDRAAGIERFTVTIGNMAPVMPDMLDVVDQEQVVRQLAHDLGMPPDLLNSEGDVRRIRRERNELIARQQEAETQQMEGEANAAMGEAAPQLEQESQLV